MSALPGQIGGFLASLPGIVGNAATAAWSAFLATTKSQAAAALAFIQAIPGQIMGFFSSAGSWLVSAGQAILQGLWNGMKAIASQVIAWISSLAAQIKAGFNAAINAHSPSKDFHDIGEGNIGGGLLNGLDAVKSKILSKMAELANLTKTGGDWSVGSGMSLSGAALPSNVAAAGTAAAGGAGITIIINNPAAERSSADVNRAARTAAFFGAF